MIFVPTRFVDKFAKKIDRSTDKFGFLGHSISNLSICRSVDFFRQINKSTDRQIDRSTINKFDLGHKNHEKT